MDLYDSLLYTEVMRASNNCPYPCQSALHSAAWGYMLGYKEQLGEYLGNQAFGVAGSGCTAWSSL